MYLLTIVYNTFMYLSIPFCIYFQLFFFDLCFAYRKPCAAPRNDERGGGGFTPRYRGGRGNPENSAKIKKII
nr:MAG TPA: hypothetical protein [Caudoviricetes sp.]